MIFSSRSNLINLKYKYTLINIVKKRNLSHNTKKGAKDEDYIYMS